MVSQIQVPKRAPDPLAKLATALNIGQSLFGISSNIDKLDIAKETAARDKELDALRLKAGKAELERKAEENTMKKRGELFQEDLIKLAATGRGRFVPRGTDKREFGVFQVKELNPERAKNPEAPEFIVKEFSFLPTATVTNDLAIKKAGVELALKQAKLDAHKKGQDLKKDQIDSAGFALRMKLSEEIFDRLKDKEFDFGGFETALVQGATEGTISFVAKNIRDTDQRDYFSGVWNWITAKLRKESGAAISATEFATDFGTFFPNIGATPGSIKTKSKLRDSVFAKEEFAAGRALPFVEKRFAELVKKRGVKDFDPLQGVKDQTKNQEERVNALEIFDELKGMSPQEKLKIIDDAIKAKQGRSPASDVKPTKQKQPTNLESLPTIERRGLFD